MNSHRFRVKDTRFEWLSRRLQDLDSQGLRRCLIPRTPKGIQFEADGQSLVNFGSNDYLGIAAQTNVATLLDQASFGDVRQLTLGAGASPLVCGYTELHDQLCQELAQFEETEAAVMFPTGFAACSSLMATLPEAGDVILSDALNHASLIDGCRLSKAERFIYPHRDVRAVQQLLAAHRQRFRNAFLVTDSIFSMDGTVAPLAELAELSREYDVIMIADEAHATGVFGRQGAGLVELSGLQQEIPLRIGTLSKAVGGCGGFVVGPRVVIDYLIQRARALIYSTASPPLAIVSALHGLAIIRSEPERRQRLLENVRYLGDRLKQAGITALDNQTPICAIIVKDNNRVVQLSALLREDGFYVPAIRPPTVPERTARLRISLSALHTEQHLDQLVQSLLRHWTRLGNP